MTDGPYKLPSGWRWLKLGEVATKPQYGYTQAASSEPAGPKFLRITDIQDSSVEWEKVPYCLSNAQALEKYKLVSGDILFARSGATTGKTFLIRELPYETIFASYLIRLKPYARELLPEFAIWFFQSPQYWKQISPRGAAQPNMNAQALQRLILPLPPLAEQRRIVARVETLMERVREAKRLRASSHQDVNILIEASLAEVFSSKECQIGWPSIGELCEIRGGLQKSPSRMPKNNPRPYLRVANVQQGYLALQDIAYFEVSDSELERYRLLPDDVLIIEGNGSPDFIGRTAIFRGEVDNCVHQNHVIRLRPNKSHILSEFLSAYLASSSGRRIIRELSHTSSGLLNLSVGKIRSIPIPPFSLSEQHRIISRLHLVQTQAAALKRAQEHTDAELRRLEQAILDRAFRGEL